MVGRLRGARRAASPRTCRARPRRPAKPVRHGIAYLAARADGAVLLETPPDEGPARRHAGPARHRLGRNAAADAPPFAADWRDRGGEVRHTFTHFHLRLRVETADRAGGRARNVLPVPQRTPRPALPTVMRKALVLGRSAHAAVNGLEPGDE